MKNDNSHWVCRLTTPWSISCKRLRKRKLKFNIANGMDRMLTKIEADSVLCSVELIPWKLIYILIVVNRLSPERAASCFRRGEMELLQKKLNQLRDYVCPILDRRKWKEWERLLAISFVTRPTPLRKCYAVGRGKFSSLEVQPYDFIVLLSILMRLLKH